MRIVALISGRGSNLQAIIDAIENNTIAAELCAVISNRPDAAGLDRAHQAGIKTIALDHKEFSDRQQFDNALQVQIDQFSPQLVVLAGFMRILSADFVNHYHGRLINIHPSLLPKYRGLDTHARAIAAGEKEHGASVHFVTPELDGGPVILQVRVAIRENDDADTLAARVLQQEHRIYPLVVGWFAEQRLYLQNQNQQVIFDNQPLNQPLQLDAML